MCIIHWISIGYSGFDSIEVYRSLLGGEGGGFEVKDVAWHQRAKMCSFFFSNSTKLGLEVQKEKKEEKRMIPTGNTASNLALSEGDSKGISQIGNFRVSPRGFGGVRSDFTILFGCLARFRCQSKIDDLYRDSFCGHFHGNHRRRSKWNAIVIDRPSRAPGHESHRSVVEQSSRISLRTSSLVGCFRSTVRLVSINRVVVVAVVVVRRPLPLKNGNELASPCHLVDG